MRNAECGMMSECQKRFKGSEKEAYQQIRGSVARTSAISSQKTLPDELIS